LAKVESSEIVSAGLNTRFRVESRCRTTAQRTDCLQRVAPTGQSDNIGGRPCRTDRISSGSNPTTDARRPDW
jgi:hypothetical protein